MAQIHYNKKIVPFLWFNGQAEEALNCYTKLFPNSEISQIKKWGENTPYPENWVMASTAILDGLQIHAFDAGDQFTFNESISFFVVCEDQKELDKYWNTLLIRGGIEQNCGWLKDKFGLSWQIIPAFLTDKMANGEPKKSAQMFQALMKMKKINIEELEKAYFQ